MADDRRFDTFPSGRRVRTRAAAASVDGWRAGVPDTRRIGGSS